MIPSLRILAGQIYQGTASPMRIWLLQNGVLITGSVMPYNEHIEALAQAAGESPGDFNALVNELSRSKPAPPNDLLAALPELPDPCAGDVLTLIDVRIHRHRKNHFPLAYIDVATVQAWGYVAKPGLELEDLLTDHHP